MVRSNTVEIDVVEKKPSGPITKQARISRLSLLVNGKADKVTIHPGDHVEFKVYVYMDPATTPKPSTLHLPTIYIKQSSTKHPRPITIKTITPSPVNLAPQSSYTIMVNMGTRTYSEIDTYAVWAECSDYATAVVPSG